MNGNMIASNNRNNFQEMPRMPTNTISNIGITITATAVVTALINAPNIIYLLIIKLH